MPIGLADAIIPFRSPYRPIWVGLGAVAFDMLLAVAITSALRRRIGSAAWRGVHWLAYACWPIAVVHGLGSGSDARLPGAMLVFVVCIAAVAAAVAWRLAAGWARSVTWRLGGGVAGAAVLVVITAFAAAVRSGPAGPTGPAPRRPSWPSCRGRASASYSSAPTPTAPPPPLPRRPRGSRPPPSRQPSRERSPRLRPTRTVTPRSRSPCSLADTTVPLQVRIIGPAVNGGVAMRRSDGDLRSLSGQVTALDGSTIGAFVTGPTGSLNLAMNLSLDPVHGTLDGPALGERRAMSVTAPPRRRDRTADGDPPAARAVGGAPRTRGSGPISTRWGDLPSPAAPADRRARGKRPRRPRRGVVPRGDQVAGGGRGLAPPPGRGGQRRRGRAGQPQGRVAALTSAAPGARRPRTRRRPRCRPSRPSCTSPRSSIATVVESAVAERRAHGLDPIAIEIVESPDTFIAGQESAVVSALGRRRAAVPSFVGLATIRERGVGGRPTLVQNVETLAHVALVARFGADWFRGVGTPENPGTMLLTVNATRPAPWSSRRRWAPLSRPRVCAGSDIAHSRGVLLGGYGGAWVSPQVFGELPVSERPPGRRERRWAPA